jgi:beta-glucosidase
MGFEKRRSLMFFFVLSVVATLIFVDAQQTPEQILAQMTLEEKAGQMTQGEKNFVTNQDMTDYFLGSVLSGGGNSPSPNTPAGWINMVNGYMNGSLSTRLKIPYIYGIDSVHGHNTIMNGTVFPHNIGYGATAVGNLSLAIENAEVFFFFFVFI